MTEIQSIHRIYHPSDFTEASHIAFCHALRIALLCRGHFHVHHVFDPHEHLSWADFPKVRDVLTQWGILHAESQREDLAKLGLKVQKVLSEDKDPLGAVLHFIDKHRPDLIVLAAHQHHGYKRWFTKEMAFPVAQHSHIRTLFIPHGCHGFVSSIDGSISLQNILIPIDKNPSPQKAIDTAFRFACDLNLPKVHFTVLHMGDEGDSPAIQIPVSDHPFQWEKLTLKGHVNESILKVSEKLSTELIVMTTAGRHGFLDALRGSTTEVVLNNTSCPLLAIPEN